MGTAVSVLEAATYGDVDAVVATGLLHKVSVPGVAAVTATAEPGPLPDPGYLTTRPGTRYDSFHRPGVVDPRVVEVDEATKDVFSETEAADGLGLGAFLPYSARIDVPVLVAVGEFDPLMCGPLASDCSTAASVLASERPGYAGSPSVSAYVMPGAGHDITLHPRAAELQDEVVGWLRGL